MMKVTIPPRNTEVETQRKDERSSSNERSTRRVSVLTVTSPEDIAQSTERED